MSELSDLLQKSLKQEKDGETKTLTKVQKPLGWDHFRKWAEWNCTNLLRATRFFFNGKAPWANSDDALHETSEFLNPGVYTFLVAAISKGMMISIGKDSRDENYDWGRAFTKEGEEEWGEAEEGTHQYIKNDDDCMEVIRNYLVSGTSFYVTMQKFNQATDRETLRVYDIWYPLLRSASAALFFAGVETGEKCKELMILEEMEKEISGFPE